MAVLFRIRLGAVTSEQPVPFELQRRPAKEHRLTCWGMQDFNSANPGATRIDRWLTAARLYKSRAESQAACTGGRVHINGQAVKASHLVKCGDEIHAEAPRGSVILIVRNLAEKRLSAELARQLYEDRSPPPPPKEDRAHVAVRERGAGRPTKADRRALDRLKGSAQQTCQDSRPRAHSKKSGKPKKGVATAAFRSHITSSSPSYRMAPVAMEHGLQEIYARETSPFERGQGPQVHSSRYVKLRLQLSLRRR